ncbi:MAG: hypothetical protein RIC55_01395 [Pirellulaceae bacterium]
MLHLLTASALCLVLGQSGIPLDSNLQDGVARRAASLPPVPYSVAAPVRNDAGSLLYFEMRRRGYPPLAPLAPPQPQAALLKLGSLESGDDPATRSAVVLLVSRLLLAQLEVVAAKDNPNLAALRERVAGLEQLARQFRKLRQRPDQELLARNRQRLRDQLETNVEGLLQSETRNHPQRKDLKQIAAAYRRILR